MKMINDLMRKVMTPGPEQETSRSQVREALELDDVNFAYYFSLFDKYSRTAEKEPIKIFPESDSNLVAYPVGVPTTPAEITAQFKHVDYARIARECDGEAARNSVLLLKKLQAGTGSSMTRNSYLQRPEMAERLNLPQGAEMKIGAKGTDLLVKIEDPRQPGKQVEISIVELQILQALATVRRGDYHQLILQDIVGPETQTRLSQIWKKKSLLDPSRTYGELLESTPGVSRFKSSFQSQVPALDEKGEISFNRVAPAGHGLFAVEALRAVLHPELLPDVSGKTLIAALANGEDLNSLPDQVMVDWMAKNRVPIVLVTTSKTPIDVKGGILCLVKNKKTGELYVKVLESAEAKAAGQLPLFEKLYGYASTNMTLFNYEVLADKLKGMSEDELLRAMAPDLVMNWKEQKDSDGVTRKYLQLEGTMGSVIMNLDRYFRKTRGEGLVSIVNVDAKLRTEFFSPVKSAFDYFLQFHSDRFEIDPKTYKLKHLGGDELPVFTLKDPQTQDKHYQDVLNVLKAFEGTSVRRLADLQVTGQVLLRGFVLEGRVVIHNESTHPVDLGKVAHQFPKDSQGRPVLKDLELRCGERGARIVA